MKKYILIHTHDYGSTCYPVQTDRDISAEIQDCEEDHAELIVLGKSLGIQDFEPHKNESVEVFEIGEEYVTV